MNLSVPHCASALACAVLTVFLGLLPCPDASAEESDIQVVVTTGVGSTVEDAARNAAENALTQVVGTFMDTETQVRRRKEIRDGVQSLTRSVDTRMSEFSQGSIASFNTLEARQDGGLFRVEASVGVRLSEFRTYVKQLASDETTLDSDVFAQVAASERNATAARDILLHKILIPALRGEVSDIRTGRPLVFAQQDETFRAAFSREIRGRLSPTTILVPVDITLKEGFLQNAVATFEEIASAKERLDVNPQGARNSRCSSQLPHEAYKHRGIVFGLHSFTGPPTLYLFNDVVAGPTQRRDENNWKLRDGATWKLEFFNTAFASFVILNSQKLPKLKVTLKGEGGTVLREIIDPNDSTLYVLKDPRIPYGLDGSESRLSHLNIGSLNDLGCFGVQRGVALYPERRIHVVMNLPSAELATIKAVEVGLFLP